jgi:crotonobetainyl-CoA:carnitine CoA-transferase CaiB-like acyl-CoA transferase
VIEFTHMVMGPTCGMILADLGAEVIKVEPPGGDKTRKLPGLGIGFFRSFNRNKKSVVLDIGTRGPGRRARADRATATWCWRTSGPADGQATAWTTPRCRPSSTRA